MKNCVINVLEFATFDFFKEYILNLVSLTSVPGALVNKTHIKYTHQLLENVIKCLWLEV